MLSSLPPGLLTPQPAAIHDCDGSMVDSDRQADATLAPNTSGFSNSIRTASPEYWNCLNFACREIKRNVAKSCSNWIKCRNN